MGDLRIKFKAECGLYERINFCAATQKQKAFNKFEENGHKQSDYIKYA